MCAGTIAATAGGWCMSGGPRSLRWRFPPTLRLRAGATRSRCLACQVSQARSGVARGAPGGPYVPPPITCRIVVHDVRRVCSRAVGLLFAFLQKKRTIKTRKADWILASAPHRCTRPRCLPSHRRAIRYDVDVCREDRSRHPAGRGPFVPRRARSRLLIARCASDTAHVRPYSCTPTPG